MPHFRGPSPIKARTHNHLQNYLRRPACSTETTPLRILFHLNRCPYQYSSPQIAFGSRWATGHDYKPHYSTPGDHHRQSTSVAPRFTSFGCMSPLLSFFVLQFLHEAFVARLGTDLSVQNLKVGGFPHLVFLVSDTCPDVRFRERQGLVAIGYEIVLGYENGGTCDVRYLRPIWYVAVGDGRGEWKATPRES